MSRSLPSRAVVHAAFLVSGFTSLVLQIAWSKALTLRLGSTLEAVSTVVAVYLGGLALGAWIAGRHAARLRRPLAGYGLLELGIGLYALVSLPLLAGLDPLVGMAYSTAGASSATYGAIRAAVSGAVLLPPTLMMGATLPWLVAWACPRGAFAASLARLYGINTLGAVAGVLVAGFWLVPGLGMTGAIRSVAVLAILLGIALGILGLRGSPASAAEPEPRVDRVAADWRRVVGVVLFALSGAVALTLEMAWTRIFSLVFGSTVYSFSVVLGAYLLGVALGSAILGGRLARSDRPWRVFAWLQVAVAAGVVMGLWLLPRLPELSMALLMTERERLRLVFLGQAGLAAWIVFGPCFALGALFPVAARLVGREGAHGARITGLAYAANTAGTLSGAILSGFVLLPSVGAHATLLGALVLALSIAVAGAGVEPRGAGERASLGVVVGTIALALAAFSAPSWDRALFTLGVYRYPGSAEAGSARATARAEIRRVLDDEELLFYREGRHSVVSVHTYRGRKDKLTLRVNGKPDAGTGEDMATQVMLGHLPMVFAPRDASVCVIGLGSGVTARAVLAHDPTRVTQVEIEPAVVEASRWFDEVNQRVLDDPRVELRLEDARDHLLHSGRRYDMIVSEPSNPWIAGVNNLFTVDFYRQVRASLDDDGVFCQWVQFYALSRRAMASLLGSFAEVFPEGEAFLFQHDLLLIGPPPGRVPGERLLLEARALDPIATIVARFDFHADGYVAAHHLGRVAHVTSLLPRTPLNTDDLPYVEYRAPLDLYGIDAGERMPDRATLYEPDVLAALERWVEPAALPAVAAAAGVELAGLGQWQRARDLASQLSAAGHLEAGRRVSEAVESATRATASADAAARAEQALDDSRFDEADAWVLQVFAIDPTSATGHLLAARSAMRRDRLDDAVEHLREVVAHGNIPQRAAAENNLGIVAMRRGRHDEGLRAFLRARAIRPGHPDSYLNIARAYAQAGRPADVRATLDDGLRRAYPTEAMKQPRAE